MDYWYLQPLTVVMLIAGVNSQNEVRDRKVSFKWLIIDTLWKVTRGPTAIQDSCLFCM